MLERDVPLQIAAEGKQLQIDRQTEIRVLYPSAENHRKLAVVEKQNDESVVLLLTMQGYRFLFTGDMENASEKAVLREMADSAPPTAAVDVLKVAHHGSKTSTSEAWLDYWQPKVAAISVGAKNLYGHPNPGVIDRLEEHHAVIFRTDRNGEVVFRTAGKELRVETMLDD
jgi:competence protein ComEC